MKKILLCFVLLCFVAACGHNATSSWANRSGDYRKVVSPECIEKGLGRNPDITNIERTLKEEYFSGKYYLRYTFSYETKDSKNPKSLMASIIDNKNTNFYHVVNVPNDTQMDQSKQTLAKEKFVMIKAEKFIAEACDIPNIDKIILPNKYL